MKIKRTKLRIPVLESCGSPSDVKILESTPFAAMVVCEFLPVGTWLSLVEHSLGVRGVGSSNLPVPTNSFSWIPQDIRKAHFCYANMGHRISSIQGSIKPPVRPPTGTRLWKRTCHNVRRCSLSIGERQVGVAGSLPDPV